MRNIKLSKLLQIRKEKLLSRAELARRAELSPLTILKIEKGQRCRPETARKIIKSLGYTIGQNEHLYQELIGPDIYDDEENSEKETSNVVKTKELDAAQGGAKDEKKTLKPQVKTKAHSRPSKTKTTKAE